MSKEIQPRPRRSPRLKRRVIKEFDHFHVICQKLMTPTIVLPPPPSLPPPSPLLPPYLPASSPLLRLRRLSSSFTSFFPPTLLWCKFRGVHAVNLRISFCCFPNMPFSSYPVVPTFNLSPRCIIPTLDPASAAPLFHRLCTVCRFAPRRSSRRLVRLVS